LGVVPVSPVSIVLALTGPARLASVSVSSWVDPANSSAARTVIWSPGL
jgi:hypothetical protein